MVGLGELKSILCVLLSYMLLHFIEDLNFATGLSILRENTVFLSEQTQTLEKISFDIGSCLIINHVVLME